MFQFELKNGLATLTKFYGSSTDIIVPAWYQACPVVAIEEAAFAQTGVRFVLLPETVSMIGKHAFINTPLEWIGCGSRDEDKESGISVIHADHIAEGAFVRTTLTDLVIASSVVERFCFAESKIRNVVFSNPDPVILGNSSFARSGLESIVLPPNLDQIPDHCFSACDFLINVRMKTVREIGFSAFAGCRNLKKLPLPEGLRKIGYEALAFTKLTSLHLPKSLEHFAPDAFKRSSIHYFEVHAENPFFRSDENGLILSCDGETLIAVPPELTGSLTLDARIKTIAESAFLGSKLTYVGLSGVVSIEEGAFRGSQINTLTLPASVESIGENAFSFCEKLYEITLPPEIPSLDLEEVFYRTPIKTVHFLGSPKEFHQSVTGEFASENVSIFYLDENGDEYMDGTKRSNIFFQHTEFTNGTCRIDLVKPGFRHIVIPSTINGKQVVSIGDYAFPMGTASVYIPDSVRELGFESFSNAIFLKSVSIPEDLFLEPLQLQKGCVVERRECVNTETEA